jgi:hypothetical protein
MEKPEQSTLDFARVPHVGGVPRYLFRSALQALRAMVAAGLRGDEITSFDRELWLCTFAGIVKQRWKDRRRPIGQRLAAAPAGPAMTRRSAASL